MSLRIIEWTDLLQSPLPLSEESAVTVGVFDGLHLGHRKLIEKIVTRRPNPTVVTFRENPKKFLSPPRYEGDLFSLKQKMDAFEQLGVSQAVLIDFSENFSRLNGWDFFDLLGDRLRMVYLAIGVNFRCGYQQKTDAGSIREMNERKGIPTELVKPVISPLSDGDPVSSSRIRSAIVSGKLNEAAILMGRKVELDLSDLRPVDLQSGELRSGVCGRGGMLVYDLRSVHRIIPAQGTYAVLIYPGKISGQAYTEDGKVFLSAGKPIGQVDALEFV